MGYIRDDGQKTITKNKIRELDGQIAELEAKTQGYGKYSNSGAPKHSPELQTYTRGWFARVNTQKMPNVLFETRDFTKAYRLNIARNAVKAGAGGVNGNSLNRHRKPPSKTGTYRL